MAIVIAALLLVVGMVTGAVIYRMGVRDGSHDKDGA